MASLRKKALLYGVLVLLPALPGAAVADEEVPGPVGAGCGFTSMTDPSREPGWQSAEVDGGPLLGDGTLTCTIQVGGNGSHAGQAAVSLSASSVVTLDTDQAGVGAAVLAPTLVSFPAYAGDPVYLCTRWSDGRGTLYLEPDLEDPAGSRWTTDPYAACGRPVAIVSTGETELSAGRGAPAGRGRPKTPVSPRGMVRIWREVAGGVHTFADPANFDPPLWTWTCSQPTLTSYQCTPPPPPGTHEYNVCRTVTVVVANDSAGDVTGRSACASGPPAEATATALTGSAASSAAPHAGFGWTCSAGESLLATAGPWSIDCGVA